MIALPTDLTLPAFIEWEAGQDSKYEFSDGRISAFPGGTLIHAAIAGDVFALLHANLRGTPCRVFIADVLTTTSYSARYPDVVVTCDPRDTENLTARTLRYPNLIVEVLSESTASVDRGAKLDEYRSLESLEEYVLIDGAKLDEYRSLESLEEYVLIDSRRRWAMAYRRSGDDWIVGLPISGGVLALSSLQLSLDLETIYDGAGLPART